MAVTVDILNAWRRPAGTIRSLLDRGRHEPQALFFLMLGCALIFVAQWPRLSRLAIETGRPLEQLVAYEAVAWLIVWPLALYLVAGLSWLGLRFLAPALTPYGARLALFWAVLASAPAGLLYGLMHGLAGSGPGAQVVGILWLAALALFWALGLREAARP
ncbi:hypothetical protein [Wenxinia marina]|uniref:hypothetical protein n=1 Tax=Wenxinia marina TaxID=390641 RepID=UPI00036799C8|nr:hypothetical protein [Wenxinia marina]GGL65341.1 hypothetical protein GCM10011392_20080 [Wenxinia marina]